MSKHYESEFKKKIVRLHLEEGRTLNGLAAEYGIAKASTLRFFTQKCMLMCYTERVVEKHLKIWCNKENINWKGNKNEV